MKKLNIFVDESGSFGEYETHSPYYIVTLVFHDEAIDISERLAKTSEEMRLRGFSNYTVHAGPLIRRDDEYRDFSIEERKKIFHSLFHFVRTADIKYHSLIVEKKHLKGDVELVLRLTKQLSSFLNEHIATFTEYDEVAIYYDYGQRELTHVLVSVFGTVLHNIDIRKVAPADYLLFQAADMICTMELLALKAANKTLSNSELTFFHSARILNKSYLRSIQQKKFGLKK